MRLSWASRRETTLEEDETYSLLSLFGISMPLIYGEGRWKAFNRLQRELIMAYNDDSIFAWKAENIPRNVFLIENGKVSYQLTQAYFGYFIADVFGHRRRPWMGDPCTLSQTVLGRFQNQSLWPLRKRFLYD